jgi:hypothetical protein
MQIFRKRTGFGTYVVLAGLTFLLGTLPSEAQDLSLLQVLPTNADHPEFGPPRVMKKLLPRMVFQTMSRKSDECAFAIEVGVSETPEIALRQIQQALNPPIGRMPEGAPSGRMLGQKSWLSPKVRGRRSGSAKFIVWDGRAIVAVKVRAKIEPAPLGKYKIPEITQADLLLAETMARDMLAKLTALGYTSKSRR